MRMKIKVIFEDGTEVKEENVAVIERNGLTQANLGLTLEESKDLTSNIQKALVEQQIENNIKVLKKCTCCLKDRTIKSYHNMVYRTLFGKLVLKSPRLNCCKCEGSSKSS